MTKNTPLREPFKKFSNWLEKAKSTTEIIEPTAMCIATVDENNKPSSRMVLLKSHDENGFCFYTNLGSRKAEQLSKNQNVALCFYYGILGLQIRIEGVVEKVSDQEADEYFASRRRESRIGAWASKQSQELQNWSEFTDRIQKIETRFADQDIIRPEFWSGFRVIPNRVEFWEEGEFRIHKREVYIKASDRKSWEVKKLYP